MAENLTQVNSYQDKLLEAMSIISLQLISSIPYDKTITCTIINDEYKTEGKYKVTNGEATFDAYSSDTTLRNDDVVYVTVPEGNYDNQKIIQGKKTSNEEKPFVFTTPFDTILDLTNNLITNNLGKDFNTKSSLIANNNYTTEKKNDIEIIKFQKAQFKEICHLKELNLTGYTRLGLKADFMSWIPIVTKGSYGLRVTVIDNLNTTTTNNQEVASVSQTKTMLLDVSDMYGSPYNFESYYTQEKVFPITELNTITDIIVEFYQIAGSFYDIDNNILTLQDATVDKTIANQYTYSTEYGENLFVDNIEVCLGYDVSEITDEYIVPVINDSMTYSHFRKDEYNKKEIDLRWVHQFENGPKVVEPDSDFYGNNPRLKDCEIRWYRYKLGAAAADEYSGVYWTGLTITKNEDKYLLSDWDGKLKTITVTEGDGEVVSKEVPDYGETQALENVIFSPDISYQTEQIKAIILLNGIAIRGPVITFRNEEDKTGEIVDNFVNALGIKCLDNTDGNYLIYNEAGNILNTADAQIERKLQCNFAEKGAEARSNLLLDGQKLDSISWKIPNEGSMLFLQNLETRKTKDGTNKEYYVIYKRKPKENSDVETELEKTEVIKFEVSKDNPEAPVYKTNDYYILQKEATFNSETNEIYYPVYKINGQYSQYTMNNTIACTVQKDRVIYNAEKDMVFGVSGTMGSDYSIAIRFVEGHNAVIIGDTDTNYSLEVKMYDANNKPVQLTDDIDIQWSWFTPGGDLEKNNLSNNISFGNNTKSSVVELKVKSLSGEDSFDTTKLDKDIYIAQVTVGSDKLTTYFPIPLKTREEFSHIEGATEVIYLSNGHPEYYKGDYKLYMITTDADGVESTQAVDSSLVRWKIFGGDEKFKGDLYYQEGENSSTGSSGKEGLRPIGVYTEGVKNYGVVCYYNKQPIWYQPILVIRNNYPSRVINKWDGKTLQIDDATGTILSTAIAAGKKEINNTFTGTMIGDWSGTTSDGSVTGATGVYGFHEGAMAYAFMDNGKAFIGKSGEGRIEFDCSEGEAIIQSPYNMSINLTSGQINAKTFSLKAGEDDEFLVLQTSTNGRGDLSLSENPLQIGKYFDVSWKGHVNARSAQIGAWTVLPTDDTTTNGISPGSIYSKTHSSWDSIILDPVLNTVTGGKFRASILEAKDTDIKLGGYIDVYAVPSNINSNIDYTKSGTGKLGYIRSNFGDNTVEGEGIGIEVNGSASGNWAYGCVKATSKNVGMSYNGSYFSMSNEAATLKFNGGSNLTFSNYGINMSNTSGGRLIADQDHIGIGYGDSYLSLYSNRTDLYDCNKIALGIHGTSNVAYLLIGNGETNELNGASIYLNGYNIQLQKNTVIKNTVLTIGEDDVNDSATLYVGGAAGTGYFKGGIKCNGITSNGDITASNSTISGNTIIANSQLTVPYNGSVNFNNCDQTGIRAQFA